MSGDFHTMLGRYADIAVRVGVNLQPGQHLIVQADLAAAALVREIVRSAYQVGAPYVHLRLGDEQAALNRYRYAPRDSFGYVPEYEMRTLSELIGEGAALLSVSSSDPDLLAGQDQALITQQQQAYARVFHPVMEQITRAATNWAIVGAPTPAWAAKMFPETAPAEREQRLWEAIFAASRVDQTDPVAAWQKHIADLASRRTYLDTKRYQALHYQGPGTDITIGLADGHHWMSGSMESQRGVTFVANLPTEEVFTMPHRERVDGIVRATKPLNFGGTLIEEFSLTFEGGRVVAVNAGKGEDLLRNLIATDEGAARLGEVALVPENSPIARSGRLFYNTLFDENAASHIALGASYRFTMHDGIGMDDETYAKAGGNSSVVHTDFMIGSGEVDIDGITASGSSDAVMRRGEWAF